MGEFLFGDNSDLVVGLVFLIMIDRPRLRGPSKSSAEMLAISKSSIVMTISENFLGARARNHVAARICRHVSNP